MANLQTINLTDFTKLAKVIWLKQQDSIPDTMRNSGLFVQDPIPYHEGDTKEYSEIDLEEYAKDKPEGDQMQIAKVQQGYTKTLRLVRRGEAQTITWEMRNRNKYPEVIKRLTGLANMCKKRMDLDLAHRITFGTAVSYVDMDGKTVDISVGDGLALFATAHTLKGSGVTYRNRLANNPQFSKSALEGMEKLGVEQTYNQFGEKMSAMFDILWTTDDPNTTNSVRELLHAQSNVDSNNAGTYNSYRDKYRHVVLPRVATNALGQPDTTKAKYWGIASSGDSTAYFAINEEPNMNAPAEGNNAEDVKTQDWTYTATCSYGIAIVGARWIKMSSGDGQP